MSTVLVDSNVWLDILTRDPVWYDWSAETITQFANDHLLALNAIIYAEVSIRFVTIEELEDALPRTTIMRLSLPWEAAFLAGKCFVRYRRRGGAQTTPLPDFFIGAHAAVAGLPLITRDVKRYRTYFPNVELVRPLLS